MLTKGYVIIVFGLGLIGLKDYWLDERKIGESWSGFREL